MKYQSNCTPHTKLIEDIQSTSIKLFEQNDKHKN